MIEGEVVAEEVALVDYDNDRDGHDRVHLIDADDDHVHHADDHHDALSLHLVIVGHHARSEYPEGCGYGRGRCRDCVLRIDEILVSRVSRYEIDSEYCA